MENISGAIDYGVYKYNNKYIVLLLDNHNPQAYCGGPNFFGIEKLFEHYINKDTMFIFEELDGLKPDDQYIKLFSQSLHLTKYMEFYSAHSHDRKKIKPIDIRILFDNFHKSDGQDLLDQFFGLILPVDEQVKPIVQVISDAKSKYQIFTSHFDHLRSRYLELKQVLTHPIKCDGSNYIEQINLTYPFVQGPNLEVCELAEQLLSGLLEIYTIANILLSPNKYIFVYLGAAHCVSICGLFDKYYQIRKVKDLSYLKIDGDKFDLETLDSHNKSCVNFNPGFVQK